MSVGGGSECEHGSKSFQTIIKYAPLKKKGNFNTEIDSVLSRSNATVVSRGSVKVDKDPDGEF